MFLSHLLAVAQLFSAYVDLCIKLLCCFFFLHVYTLYFRLTSFMCIFKVISN